MEYWFLYCRVKSLIRCSFCHLTPEIFPNIRSLISQNSPSVVSSPMSVFAKLCLNFGQFWHNMAQVDVISANFVIARSWSWNWILFQNYCLQIVDFLLYSRQNITVVFVINSEWNQIIICRQIRFLVFSIDVKRAF